MIQSKGPRVPYPLPFRISPQVTRLCLGEPGGIPGWPESDHGPNMGTGEIYADKPAARYVNATPQLQGAGGRFKANARHVQPARGTNIAHALHDRLFRSLNAGFGPGYS